MQTPSLLVLLVAVIAMALAAGSANAQNSTNTTCVDCSVWGRDRVGCASAGPACIFIDRTTPGIKKVIRTHYKTLKKGYKTCAGDFGCRGVAALASDPCIYKCPSLCEADPSCRITINAQGQFACALKKVFLPCGTVPTVAPTSSPSTSPTAVGR